MVSALADCNKQQSSVAYHLISVNVLNLLLAIDDRAVHTHGLIHKAHAARKVEAVCWPMIDNFRLFWWRELKLPWLPVYSQLDRKYALLLLSHYRSHEEKRPLLLYFIKHCARTRQNLIQYGNLRETALKGGTLDQLLSWSVCLAVNFACRAPERMPSLHAL